MFVLESLTYRAITASATITDTATSTTTLESSLSSLRLFAVKLQYYVCVCLIQGEGYTHTGIQQDLQDGTRGGSERATPALSTSFGELLPTDCESVSVCETVQWDQSCGGARRLAGHNTPVLPVIPHAHTRYTYTHTYTHTHLNQPCLSL